MRFSDLNKMRKEEPATEPGKRARPAAAPVKEKARAPAPPEVKTAVAAELPPVQAPETAAPEAAKQPLNNGSAKSRRETRALARAPAIPFKDQDEQAREVYARVLDQAGVFLKSVDQTYTEKYESVLATCRLVTDTLKTNGVLVNYTSYSTAEDYLRAHTANTTIMALALGQEAGLPASELSLLGFCAMAHDIGMTEHSSLYNSPGRLDEKEFSEMSLHAEAGVAKLDRIVDLDYKIKDRARTIVLQTHERADGSGYPDRLSDEAIDPLSQYISIADVYEAMTHPRAWRDAINPPDAIKELVEKEGRGFNSRAVKALIAAVSIYPPGSLVALSSGEIVRVIRVTRGFLTKPLVQILLDSDFDELEPRTMDLFEHPLTSIERAVSLKEVEARNPKFAAKLELARWWVEW